jgi:hypothetical protein
MWPESTRKGFAAKNPCKIYTRKSMKWRGRKIQFLVWQNQMFFIALKTFLIILVLE